MLMQMVFKMLTTQTHSLEAVQDSCHGKVISFVEFYISYGDSSYLNYCMWRAKEQCLSQVHSVEGWPCTSRRHTQSWCRTSPNFVSLINFLLVSSPVVAGRHHCHTVSDCRKGRLWSYSCGCLSCQRVPDSGLISVPGKIVPLTKLVRAPTERGPFQRQCSLLHCHLLPEPYAIDYPSHS